MKIKFYQEKTPKWPKWRTRWPLTLNRKLFRTISLLIRDNRCTCVVLRDCLFIIQNTLDKPIIKTTSVCQFYLLAMFVFTYFIKISQNDNQNELINLNSKYKASYKTCESFEPVHYLCDWSILHPCSRKQPTAYYRK